MKEIKRHNKFINQIKIKLWRPYQKKEKLQNKWDNNEYEREAANLKIDNVYFFQIISSCHPSG